MGPPGDQRANAVARRMPRQPRATDGGAALALRKMQLKVDISALTAVHDIRPPGHQRGIALKSAFSSLCKAPPATRRCGRAREQATVTSSTSEKITKRTWWTIRTAKNPDAGARLKRVSRWVPGAGSEPPSSAPRRERGDDGASAGPTYTCDPCCRSAPDVSSPVTTWVAVT